MADQITLELGSLIKQVSLLANNIYRDRSLFEFCDTHYSDFKEYEKMGERFTQITGLEYSSSIDEIKDLRVYVDNDSIINTKHIKRITESVRNQWWYQKFNAQDRSMILMEDLSRRVDSIYSDNAGTLSVIRKLNYFDSEREMILVMDLDYNVIYNNIIKSKSEGDVYICNSNRILFTNDKSILSRNSLPVIQAIREEKISVKKDFPVMGETWGIYVLTNKVPFWYAIFTSKQLFLVIFLINLILPTTLIGKMTTSVIKRLNLLEEHFDGIQEESFELFQEPISNDEIGQLYRHYNKTVVHIQNLIETIVQKNDEKNLLEVSKKQAEINALISQVNPHFMYNTLECIYMRSLIKGENETANVILSLSTLLRQMSKWHRDVLKVEEELDLVRKYLQIQKYRFDEKLNFDVDFEEICRDVLVPKLSIVSFVENACIHGIEESLEQGKIYVKVRKIDTNIQIEVIDSGCGMEEEALEQLKEKLHNADIETIYTSKSTGILNAYIRLKMYYGRDFKFNMESKASQGTRILIILENTFS